MFLSGIPPDVFGIIEIKTQEHVANQSRSRDLLSVISKIGHNSEPEVAKNLKFCGLVGIDIPQVPTKFQIDISKTDFAGGFSKLRKGAHVRRPISPTNIEIES